MVEVKLLSTWVTPFGLRVKLALEMKGVKYEEVEEDLQSKSELLIRSNPIHKKVPVLIHNGRPLCESRIIVEYVDEVWPTPRRFLPEDPHRRALARFWADYADKKFVPTLVGMLFKAGEEVEKAKRETIESIEEVEKGHAALNPSAEHPFFGGEHPGYVDILFAPFLTFLRVCRVILDFELPLHHHHFPRFARWMQAVEEHPAMGKCLPDVEKVVEFFVPLREKRLQA